MPHLILEYSRNIGNASDLAPLLAELHNTVGSADSVDIEAVKSRMYGHEIYFVGAESARRAFLHLEVKVLPGRTLEWKRTLGEKLHKTMKAKVAGLLAPEINCSTTVDFVDLVEATYFRTLRP